MRVGCKSGSRTGPALSTEGPVRLRRQDAQVNSRRARTSVLFLVHEVFCEALQQSTPVPIVGPEPAPYSIRGLALVAAFGRYWPPVKNSPSDVSYKMAGSGRLKRSSTTATSLRSAAAAGAPGLEKSAANPNRELSHFVANLLILYSFSIQIFSNCVTQSNVSSYEK